MVDTFIIAGVVLVAALTAFEYYPGEIKWEKCLTAQAEGHELPHHCRKIDYFSYYYD